MGLRAVSLIKPAARPLTGDKKTYRDLTDTAISALIAALVFRVTTVLTSCIYLVAISALLRDILHNSGIADITISGYNNA